MRSFKSFKSTLVPHISSRLKPKRRSSIRPIATQTRTMAFSPRGLLNSNASFSPLFRLLDDFDHYAHQEGGHLNGRRSGLSQFQPKFDIRETADSYELHGELPGMSKENVNINFTEPQSLLISGKFERTYTAGTPPAGHIEGSNISGTITEGEGTQKSSTGTSMEKKGGDQEDSADEAKYWLTERSVGTFSRSFNFPTPINQDAVSASLKDGVLSIVVPKTGKPEGRRITIE